VLDSIGGFNGQYILDANAYHQPVLVSATDGVGTKLKIAQLMNKHDTVGIDLVAMVVNDIVVSGAKPLFFLDYLAIGKLVPKKVENIVAGIAQGCQIAECVLIGGETAEHPGVMTEDDYDLAGFGVGIAERDQIIKTSDLTEGDLAIGLASSGLHSNGFSLIRKIFSIQDQQKLETQISSLKTNLGDELLRPTRIYVKAILNLVANCQIKGVAHITGGGIVGNISRILPKDLDLELQFGSWFIPPIFDLIEQHGQIEKEEMFSTFNMGVGMVVFVSPDKKEAALKLLVENQEQPYIIGTLVPGHGEVRLS
jgi:phosphoribosylformylglycinamidine cyclo-ligase